MKFWKWTHKWFSIVLGVFVILWAVSGILLNHRSLISQLDINRNNLPENYQYKNWNNAAVRSGLTIGTDSILVYGNLGIWLSDSTLSRFSDFMQGFPEGMDNRKINKIYLSHNKLLWAATQSGLYEFKANARRWEKIPLDLHDERIVDITAKDDRIVFLTRSELIIGYDRANSKNFDRFELPRAVDDDGLIGLFRTLWVLHSGEIYGFYGKLAVDLFALLLIFLVITGYIYFFFPHWIKSRKRKNKAVRSIRSPLRFSIKWHQKIGIWAAFFLLFTTVTGMFLRPPLLIAIGNERVTKIPFSNLSNPNPWHDRLRAIHWNEQEKYWLIGSTEGFYKATENFSGLLVPFSKQPPISVMGINVFDYHGNDTYLVGSFNGLFWWQPHSGYVLDAMTGEIPKQQSSASSPLGKFLISGLVETPSKRYIFDYGKGLLNAKLLMPMHLQQCPMPLWNVALEIHTGRIFQNMLGSYYILLVPLMGLLVSLIIIGGAIRWYVVRKRRGLKKIEIE